MLYLTDIFLKESLLHRIYTCTLLETGNTKCKWVAYHIIVKCSYNITSLTYCKIPLWYYKLTIDKYIFKEIP